MAGVWVAFTVGCGYVGPVVPPSPAIPASVTDLSVAERGDQLIIQFTTPARTTDNLTISHLEAVDLRIGAAAEPPNEDEWARSAQQIPLSQAVSGVQDRSVAVEQAVAAQSWVGKRVAVMVRTSSKKGDHYSSWSNRAVLQVLPPLDPPEVSVDATAQGYLLKWPATPQNSDQSVQYDVRRQGVADKEPVLLATTEKPEYLDASAQWDVPYRFTVLAREGAATSLPSKEQAVQAADVFPPSTPADVAAFASGDQIQVTWTRSPESDLASYFVYRAQGTAPYARIGEPAKLPVFTDTAVQHGQTYHYAVSAVDRKGNESARSAPADVTLP